MNTLSLVDLPTELLIEICWLCDNPQLSIICRHLCSIIHSTPLFWTTVKQHTPEAASFLSKRLERGAACPLDVIVRAMEPLNTVTTELWHRLSIHRYRIRTLDIGTDTVTLCGTILQKILLTRPKPSTLPLLQKLDIRHDEDLDVPYQRYPMDPGVLLYPMPSLFPSLTTLVLPLLDPCIPYPESPIPSLTTLVLDGSMSWSWDCPGLYQMTQFLAQTPQLETLWCKEHRVFTHVDFSTLCADPFLPDRFGTLSVKLPVLLPRLTTMAIAVPGPGIDLIHLIEAPALQDLHMDGTRDDEYYEDEVEWLDRYPPELHAGLEITSSRSPALRRLSLVGAYLSRDTWLWLFGCGEMHSLPFPLLESIALHKMKAVKDEVTNTLHDALADLSSRQREISIALRRFAYIASEPPLHGVALHNLVNAVGLKQAAPGYIFEIEMDGVSSVDFKEQLDSLLSKDVRVRLREESTQRKNWWELGKDIDPMEADSY